GEEDGDGNEQEKPAPANRLLAEGDVYGEKKQRKERQCGFDCNGGGEVEPGSVATQRSEEVADVALLGEPGVGESPEVGLGKDMGLSEGFERFGAADVGVVLKVGGEGGFLGEAVGACSVTEAV